MKTNKPDFVNLSGMLMISPLYDQRLFFQPELTFLNDGIEALIALRDESEDELGIVEIIDKTAVVSIEGPLRPGGGWYYSTGYKDIQNAANELKKNESIETVILKIDSPGGTVKEAFETERVLRDLAATKNLIAITTGSMTSAAALLSFPAKKRYISSLTNQLGSIGVVATHIDEREWFKNYMGEVRTSVAKGEMKDAGSSTRSYDAKAKKAFTEAVDTLYNVFVDTAEASLNLTRQQIIDQKSAVFIGQDAIDQGLADGIASISDLIEQSNNVALSPPPVQPAFENHEQEIEIMDIEKLKAEHPEVYQALIDQGKAEGGKEKETAAQTAAQEAANQAQIAERNRAATIRKEALPGQEAVAAKLIDEGATIEEARAAFLEAHRAAMSKIGNDIEAGTSAPVASDAPEMTENPEPGADDWDSNPALRDEFGGVKERYEAYKKADAEGRIRTF